MSRIRKALVAGILAAFSVAVTQVTKDGLPANPDGWAGLLGGMAAAFAIAAFATYKVRNAGTINGSDPAGGSTLIR
jgi:hypothetical protein